MFLDKNKDQIVQQFDSIAAQEGVVDCVLFDFSGKVIFSTSNSPEDNKLFDNFGEFQKLLGISRMYTGPDGDFENVHLDCASGAVVLWDMGIFIFAVAVSGMLNSAELRIRVNVLKHSMESNKRLLKYYREAPSALSQLRPDESEHSLFEVLQGIAANDTRS